MQYTYISRQLSLRGYSIRYVYILADKYLTSFRVPLRPHVRPFGSSDDSQQQIIFFHVEYCRYNIFRFRLRE